MTDADNDLERLSRTLEGHRPLAIAVSGGVDSMTLAYVAHRAVDAHMIHATSPAVPAEAGERVRDHARRHGWRLTVTDAREFADPRYLANPANRCYFCKTNLYSRIAALTDRRIASGANLDDLDDYRPGLTAARERQVVHPLIEAGIDKAGVRRMARELDLLDLAELPAQPCLASRVETGIAIDAGDLAFVHGVETALRAISPSLATLRCRLLRRGVLVETEPDIDPGVRSRIEAIGREMAKRSGRPWAGWAPYRRGSAFRRPDSAVSP